MYLCVYLCIVCVYLWRRYHDKYVTFVRRADIVLLRRQNRILVTTQSCAMCRSVQCSWVYNAGVRFFSFVFRPSKKCFCSEKLACLIVFVVIPLYLLYHPARPLWRCILKGGDIEYESTSGRA